MIVETAILMSALEMVKDTSDTTTTASIQESTATNVMRRATIPIVKMLTTIFSTLENISSKASAPQGRGYLFN